MYMMMLVQINRFLCIAAASLTGALASARVSAGGGVSNNTSDATTYLKI